MTSPKRDASNWQLGYSSDSWSPHSTRSPLAKRTQRTSDKSLLALCLSKSGMRLSSRSEVRRTRRLAADGRRVSGGRSTGARMAEATRERRRDVGNEPRAATGLGAGKRSSASQDHERHVSRESDDDERRRKPCDSRSRERASRCGRISLTPLLAIAFDGQTSSTEGTALRAAFKYRVLPSQ